ncbi:unnamed protein product, partial [Callosobruchus maculatus]
MTLRCEASFTLKRWIQIQKINSLKIVSSQFRVYPHSPRHPACVNDPSVKIPVMIKENAKHRHIDIVPFEVCACLDYWACSLLDTTRSKSIRKHTPTPERTKEHLLFFLGP